MPIAASSNLTLDRGADWAKILRIVDNNGDPVPLNPAVLGVKQVETNTVVGTAGSDGVYGVQFVSALTGTRIFAVPVLTGNTAAVTAKRCAASMNDDEVFSVFWIATASGADIIVTSKFFRANDATCSLAVGVTDQTTATGYTQDLASTNTTAGVAQVFGEFVFEGQLKLRPGAPSLGDFVFEVIGDGTAGQVRIWLPYPITLRLAANSYHYDWLVYRNGYRFRTVRGQATVRGDITVPGTYVFPSTPVGSIASTEWGEIGGLMSNQTDLAAALAAKLSNITGYVTAGSNVTITGSGTLASPYVISASGGGGGGDGSFTWGMGDGDIADQTDLYSELQTMGASITVCLAHAADTANPHSVTKTQVGLGNVENTALSTWTGSANIATVGTITSGTWNGTVISTTRGGTGMNNSALVADRYLYTNGTGTFTSGTITAAGRAILDDADATAQRATLGFTTNTTNITVGNINCQDFVASVGGSTLSFSGGAIVITQAAPNPIYIDAVVGVDVTGPIFYHQGSDATGDTYYRDSSGQLKRLPIGSTGRMYSVSGGLPAWVGVPVVIPIACSDETTAITTGNAKVTFRMPFAMTLTAVRASVTTAPTGSTIIIDINETGSTILSTKLSIDASEKTSTTAASAAVISDTSLADDAEITIDFDQVGSSVAGAGVKVYLIGTRT